MDPNCNLWMKPVSYPLDHKDINGNKLTFTEPKNFDFNFLQNSKYTGLKLSQSKGFDAKIHFQNVLFF